MGSIRLTATRYIWLAFALAMGLTFSDVALYGNSPGIGHVIIAAIVASAAFLSTGMVWNWGVAKFDDEMLEESAKAKRRHSRKLEKMLDRLSEDDLDALRDRLNADAEVGYSLTADGELERRVS